MEQGEQDKAIIIEPISVPGVKDMPAPTPEPLEVEVPEEEEVLV